MAKKKSASRLPRHDRSRSLPVRRGWGLWKTLVVAVAVAVFVVVTEDVQNGPDPTPPQVVSPQ